MRDLSKKTAHKWDSFSNEAHVKWTEELDKIKSINL
jgi:hypothetical protein